MAHQHYREAKYNYTVYTEKVEVLKKQCEQITKDLEKQDVQQDISQLQKDVQVCTKLDVEIIL
jgi:hypothetical protein